ncbi:MAG TPA: tripartite tricarboxylate transporter substrate-binding protein [Rectinemataceae bacterium]|nr:tripartite tricarboxylate transporter substrate-binding protein [Rectinemataceae bacterium]
MKRSQLVGIAMVAAMLTLAVSGLGAQAYPTKPIKLVVGFGPGGVGDLTARTVAAKVSEMIGQQILIDNRPSAGGIVAADAVAKAAPDGYTIFLMSNGNAVSESLYKSLPFDLQKDFAMVTTLGFFDLAVVVKGDSPHATMKDLLAWLRANPGKENIGTINVGSTQNLAAELLLSLGDIDAEVIPYKGSPDVLVALRGNDVQVGVDMLAPLVNQAKSGAVKILATTGEQRYAGTPTIPTVAESGIPGYSASSWNAIAVPAKTPQAIVDFLNKEFNAALASPDVRAKLLELGVTAKGGSPDDMKKLVDSEVTKWDKVIARAGIVKQ